MNLLHSNTTKGTGQWGVSPQRRLPVDDITTATVQSVTGEAVQFYYYTTAGALTQDAGQAAGTVVVANLANKNILNALGDCVGSYGDSSFSFGTGTVLVTAKRKPFRSLPAEDAMLKGLTEAASGQAKAIAVTLGFQDGEWCLDSEAGIIYGKKATTGTSDTASYKVLVPGGSSSVPSNINISQVGGVAVPTSGGDASSNTRSDAPTSARLSLYNGTTWDRARSGQTSNSTTVTGFTNSLPFARYNATPTARTEAQFGALQQDVNGGLMVNLNTLIEGEDPTNHLMKVEQRFSATRATADTQIKGSAGFIHTISIAPTTATPTAGLLTIYDSTSESGTALYSEWVFATTPGHTITLNCTAANGIYVGYDASLANVSCTVTYR